MPSTNSSHRVVLKVSSVHERCLWLFLTLVVLAWQGSSFIRSLYPPRTITFDFYQDWSSARNFLNGHPIYTDIGLTIENYLGWRLPENWPASNWRVNNHPPPLVLLKLPLAWLDYPDAFLLWSMLSLAAFTASLWLIARQLSIRVSSWSLLPFVSLLLVWYPFRDQVTQGQINLVLLLMVTVVWAAERSGWSWTAGVILAAATAVKLFPGLLFAYFVLRRQWRVAASAVATLVVITGVSVVVLGPEAYYAYFVDVLPASGHWLSNWHNNSLVGFWFKLFDPASVGGVITPLWRSPIMARVGALVSCAILVSIMMWVIVRAKNRSDLDQTFGLTVTAMLLVSPITWSHYLVLLMIPLAIMWVDSRSSAIAKWTWIVIVVVLFVPAPKVWRVLIPGGWHDGVANPLQTITALSFPCYALVGLFILQAARTEVNPSVSKVGPKPVRVDDVPST
jgi:Glycosyltransferase family 87